MDVVDVPIPSLAIFRDFQHVTVEEAKQKFGQSIFIDPKKFPSKPVGVMVQQNLLIDDPKLELRRRNDMNKYREAQLNPDQKEIYNYVSDNPTNIVVIQAGPGTGKTFTLLCIAYTGKYVTTTIIYKHDLLTTFCLSSNTMTVTSFIMNIFNIKFMSQKYLLLQLCGDLSGQEYLFAMVSLLRKASIPKFKKGIVILDEYTIIPKPILTIALTLLEHYEIGTIVCGDRNQLQNIHNSKHATSSSYSIARFFAHKVFMLDINERCSDEEYNTFIQYISQFSSSTALGSFAYALIAVMFFDKLFTRSKYNSIHLAGHHQDLADSAHGYVMNNKYEHEDYLIPAYKNKLDDDIPMINGFYQPQALTIYKESKRIGKFLPYLPIVVGARYYVLKHSEFCQGTMKAYDKENETITMIMDDGNEEKIIKKTTECNGVIFSEHLDYLKTGVRGQIYNYPIYPANFMSIHKCQGCTISQNLDINLTHTNYQGLYVALSRVTNPSKIDAITIPDVLNYVVSSMLNFPELIDKTSPISVHIIESRMVNYKHYDISKHSLVFWNLCEAIMTASDVKTKIQRLGDLRQKVQLLCLPITLLQPPTCSRKINTTDLFSNDEMTVKFIKYRNLFLALSFVAEDQDRSVWLHEFSLCEADIATYCMNQKDKKKKPTETATSNDDDDGSSKSNSLNEMTNLSESYPINMSSMEYIKNRAKLLTAKDSADNKDDDDDEGRIVELEEGGIKKRFKISTKFCYDVFMKYQRGEAVTTVWLVNTLSDMVESIIPVPGPTSSSKGGNNKKRQATLDGFFKKKISKHKP